DASCYKRDFRFEKSVFIWGDSHAQSLSPGITHYIPSNWQILQVASSGCSPNSNIDSPSEANQCAQSNFFAMQIIKTAKPDVVVVAKASGHSVDAMNDIAQKLKTLGAKKILFIGPTPKWIGDLPKI